MILIGPPNTIQRYFLPSKKGGYWVQVKYGNDGWATKIRHETDHYGNGIHTNPHDHIIDYDPSHAPIFLKPQINYPAEAYPDGAPEFKFYCQEVISKMAFQYSEETMRFKTISEFKRSLCDGGEIVIEWHGSSYGIFSDGKKFILSRPDGQIEYYESIDHILEVHINDYRIRDIITQVIVIDRAL